MTRLDDFARKVLEDYFRIDIKAHPELADALRPHEVAGGAWLFRQGDPGDALHFLIRGRLDVWRENAGEGASTLIGEVVPGESVGEVGLLTHAPRSASVRAIRDSLLIEVDRETFERLAAHSPALVLKLAASVAERLQRSTAGHGGLRASLATVAIIPADPSARLAAHCDRLAEDLASTPDALILRPEQLVALGAPNALGADDADLDEALKHWISSLEGSHRRLVFRASPGDSAWLRFSARQADVVVLVAAADSDPQLRSWESEITLPGDAARGVRQALMLLHPEGTERIRGTARWLTPRPGSLPLHVRPDHPEDHGRAVRILTGNATGLVLGGGAARGFAHLGVYQAMHELGIPVDWVGGTSIGAIMAAAIGAAWGPETAIANARKAFVGGKPFGDYTLPVVSLLRGGRMQRQTRIFFPDDIEDLPTPYFGISSNLGTGNVNVHERGELWRAICSSAALPGVMPPTVYQGQLTVDGSVLNNLPVDVMQQKLVRRIIAVELTPRRNQRVDFVDLPSPWAILRGRMLPFQRRYRLPGVATMMLKATEVGTRRFVQELGKRADVLLTPPVDRFSILKVTHFDAVVAAGYNYALEALGAWQAEQSSRPRP